ncbi:MAG TPA: hypothetical protein VNU97_11590 [Rhizomicrobium sp.]|jgi:hypothetical protein|nr:hypothetical protein [Rhizomicrobium sp.]
MEPMDREIAESAEAAARLDRLLAAAVVPAVPARLERRILADFDNFHARWTFAKVLRRAADAVWPDAPAWQPACAFALALLIGTGVAALAPFDIPQQDDAASSAFALDGAPDIDAGQGI